MNMELDLRQLGKVLIFRDRHSPIIYRFDVLFREYLVLENWKTISLIKVSLAYQMPFT